METNPILEKLKKLLELQRSAQAVGSLEEAANAAMKIQGILLKYNLEMADIELHEGKKKSAIVRESLTNVMTKKNESDWIIKLYGTVARFNFGLMISSTRTDFVTGNRFTYVNLVGTKENIEVIGFISSQLEFQVRNLENISWKNNRKESSKRNSYRRAYFEGAILGIQYKLEEAQKLAMAQSNNITTLVIDHTQRINDELPNLFNNLKYSNAQQKMKKDAYATINGYKDGKNVNINPGVGSAQSQKHLG